MEHDRKLSDLTANSWTVLGSHTQRPLAVVFSDDLSTNLGSLTSQRCKAALPFAGKYRLIDFALSNCVNSEIEQVGVITQYQPRSLHTHLSYGRPWDLDRREGGLSVLHPYQARSEIGWYTGTADALYQNQDFIRRSRSETVLVMSGCEVYVIDLVHLAQQHSDLQADLTIAAVTLDRQQACRYTTLSADPEGRVTQLIEPGAAEPGALTMMGVLLFSTEALTCRLSEDAARQESDHDLIRNLLPEMIRQGDRVMAFESRGYWSGIQTVHDYWQANINLLSETASLNLQDAAWPIRTQSQTRPPTRCASGSRISHSLLSDGCIIDGTVEYSILSPGVYVAPGAVVRNAVVLHDTTIEERAIAENAILDADVIVGQQAHVGRAVRHAPTLLVHGQASIAVVPQGAHVPAQTVFMPDPTEDNWILPTGRRLDSPSTRAAPAH